MSELGDKLDALGITIKSNWLYVDFTDINYPVDKWICSLSFEDKTESFEFQTGYGHRRLAHRVKKEGSRKWYHHLYHYYASSVKEAIDKNFLLVSDPKIEDVVSSLLSDCSAKGETFHNWCSDFGMNNDSIHSQNIYLACQKNADKLYHLLGSSIIAELST